MELLKNFSLSEIIIFVVLLLSSVKGIITFFDWLITKGTQIFVKRYQKPKELENNVQEMTKAINELTKKVNMLIESDKDDIKAFITRQHHYFVYQKGWIDDYSLDCIEKRYNHYQDEGGNSFIGSLMQEIRDLPKKKIQGEEGK